MVINHLQVLGWSSKYKVVPNTSYKWSYGALINGKKYIGNWGYFTPKEVKLFHTTYN